MMTISSSDSPNPGSSSAAIPSTDTTLNKPWNRRRIILAAFVVSIVAIILINVPITVINKKSSPTDRYSKIRAIVQSISSHNDLYNASSLQARALDWIVYDDTLNISEIHVPWIRQRYILAVFYYSTGGNSTWSNTFQFLSPTHECTWNDPLNGNGIWCDSSTMNILEMVFGKCNIYMLES